MESQFGLLHVWEQGDWVTRAVALLLLGMSCASWLVIFFKAANIIRYKKMAHEADGFWLSTEFSEGLNRLSSPADNPFRHLAEAACGAALHHRNTQEQRRDQLHDHLNISDWITRCLRQSIDNATAHLQTGLAVLASVGSTAPFVGLFGTVWGIYHALLNIGLSGQSTIDKVAGPIGESLIMTALGLAVAIPAVLGYNTLVRGNKAVLGKLNNFAHDLHAYFVTGARIGAIDNSGEVLSPKKA